MPVTLKTLTSGVITPDKASIALIPVDSNGAQTFVTGVNVADQYISLGEVTSDGVSLDISENIQELKNDVGEIVASSYKLTGGKLKFSVYSPEAESLMKKLTGRNVRIVYIDGTDDDGKKHVRVIPKARISAPTPKRTTDVKTVELTATLAKLPAAQTILKTDLQIILGTTLAVTGTDISIAAGDYYVTQSF